MAHDKDGNLWPLMLSELIAAAQETLAKHGDMPCWVTTADHGYDDTERHSVPIGYAPRMETSGPWRDGGGWWHNGYKTAFVIHGSPTG